MSSNNKKINTAKHNKTKSHIIESKTSSFLISYLKSDVWYKHDQKQMGTRQCSALNSSQQPDVG